jgi:hypothetical protein
VKSLSLVGIALVGAFGAGIGLIGALDADWLVGFTTVRFAIVCFGCVLAAL